MTENLNLARNVDIVTEYCHTYVKDKDVIYSVMKWRLRKKLFKTDGRDDFARVMLFMTDTGLLIEHSLNPDEKRFDRKLYTGTVKLLALSINGGLAKQVIDKQSDRTLQRETNTAVKYSSIVQTLVVTATLIIVSLDYCQVRRTADIQQKQQEIERAAHRLQQLQLFLQTTDSLYPPPKIQMPTMEGMP